MTTENPTITEGGLSPEEQKKAELRARMLKGQEKMRELRAAGWKPVILNPVEKAKENPGSLKLAVKAHCWTCCGAGADAGVKFHVRDCAVKSCSLWPHRPWQTIKGGLAMNAEGVLEVAPGSEDEAALDD